MNANQIESGGLTVDKITIPAELLTEYSPHHFDAEASELRMKPGCRPTTFHVHPKLGNGLPFHMVSRDEWQTVYRQELGCVNIKVWNT